MTEPQYVGLWIRFIATLINSVVIMLVVIPVALLSYGELDQNSALAVSGNYAVNLAIVAAFVLLWIFRNAEPGKMMFRAVIVDAETLEKAKPWQYLVRYIGYYISLVPLGLGFIWIAFDKRKQGWHDKIAGTVVITRPREEDAEP